MAATVSLMQLAEAVLGSGTCSTLVTLWFNGRARSADHASKHAEAEVRREEHRDGLTFELIEAARVEIRQLRDEVSRLRPMEAHIVHLEEGLLHVERLLTTSQDDSEWKRVEREARAFLNRMRRLSTAVGTVRNEVQRADSAVAVVARKVEEDHGNGNS